jgi:ABC-type transport system involved in cytochrome c biogenesis permease subunit
MKRLAVPVMFVVVAAVCSTPILADTFTWMSRVDARPEAVLTGTALLALASILRRSYPNRGAR